MAEMTMRERVAWAILGVEIDLESFRQRGWSLAPEKWSLAMQSADAAIRAMRVPTQAMIEAGRWPAEDDGPLAAWRAMIDAALAEQSST